MNKPTTVELFVAAKTWSEAKVMALAIAEGRIPVGDRHVNRETAEAWCAKLNDCLPPGFIRERIWNVEVKSHFGPDGKIYNYRDLGG